MPNGPQTSDDVEEPRPARLAALKDPGTLDQIVLDTFPESAMVQDVRRTSRTRFTTSRKSTIDAVVPQVQFHNGCMGDGGRQQIACFFVGTDTSSRAIHTTMVPDFKMDVPYVVAGTAKWVRDLEYLRLVATRRHRRSSSVACGHSGKRMSSRRTRLANSPTSVHRHRAIGAPVPR